MEITAITVPKWGLEMEEGTLVEWHIEEGDQISAGDDLVEIETEKVTNVVESPVSGMLVRRLGAEDETYPCGALLGVLADPDEDAEKITEFIDQFEALESTRSQDDGGPAPEFIEIDGHRIRFLKMGDSGPPVILIHGFGGDLQNWMFVQPDLAADHVTYAIDLPGHGGSGKDLEGVEGLDGLAAIVLGALDALDLDAAHLIGHSMGGEVAIRAIIAAPEKILSLTLLAPTGAGSSAAEAFVDGFVSARRGRDLRPAIEMLFSDPALISRDLVDNLIKYKRLDGVKDALGKFAEWLALPSTALFDATEVLADVPVTLVWGTEDQIVPFAADMELPEGIKLELLAGMGHMPHLEASQQIVRIVRALIT